MKFNRPIIALDTVGWKVVYPDGDEVRYLDIRSACEHVVNYIPKRV